MLGKGALVLLQVPCALDIASLYCFQSDPAIFCVVNVEASLQIWIVITGLPWNQHSFQLVQFEAGKMPVSLYKVKNIHANCCRVSPIINCGITIVKLSSFCSAHLANLSSSPFLSDCWHSECVSSSRNELGDSYGGTGCCGFASVHKANQGTTRASPVHLSRVWNLDNNITTSMISCQRLHSWIWILWMFSTIKLSMVSTGGGG